MVKFTGKTHGDIDPFKVIDAIFKQNRDKELIIHQIASYDQFITKDIGDIIRQFNTRKLLFQFDPEINKHHIELHIDFLNYNLGKPTISENDGSIQLMTPDIARLRNLTYSAPLTINLKLTRIVRYVNKTSEIIADIDSEKNNIHNDNE